MGGGQMSERPGIMIYFDVLPALEYMNMEQRGQWITAALEYSHYGVVPQLEGPCAMAWAFTKPKLDHDKERYNFKCLQSQYAAYCRVEKKQGREPVEFEMWHAINSQPQLSDDNKRYQEVSSDVALYPTTTPTVNPTTAATPTPPIAASPKTEGAGEAEGTGVQGEGRGRTQDDEFNTKRNKALAQLEGYGIQ